MSVVHCSYGRTASRYAGVPHGIPAFTGRCTCGWHTFLAVMSTRVHGLVWTCGFGSLGTRRSGIAGSHGDCLTAEESLVSLYCTRASLSGLPPSVSTFPTGVPPSHPAQTSGPALGDLSHRIMIASPSSSSEPFPCNDSPWGDSCCYPST